MFKGVFMKEKKLIYCIACLGIVVIGGIIVWAFHNHNATTKNKIIHKSNDLIQYLGDYWEIELEDYAEDAEGEVEMYDDEEDGGVIKVKIRMEYEETVLELLKNNLIKIKGNPYDRVPPFPSNSLVSEVETKEWKYTFWCTRVGKYAKTRILYAFVTYDNYGMYIYF